MNPDNNSKEDGAEAVEESANALSRYGSLGVQMAICIVGGILLGHWLDRSIGWKFPVLTLVLLFLGTGAAFWIGIRASREKH